MSIWSRRKQFTYLSMAVAFLALAVGVPAYFLLYEEPTCSDGKQNGNESGIDCGGSCSAICENQAAAPRVLWSRVLPVAEGIWNVVALVENLNPSAEAYEAPYVFKIFDDRNILIYERKGKTFIPTKSVFPVFEASIITGMRKPAAVFFEFSEMPDWQRAGREKPDIRIRSKKLLAENGGVRLEATLENRTLDRLDGVEAVAIISGGDGNAIAVSRTVVESLAKEESRSVVFTWPSDFSAEAAVSDIYIRDLP